MLVNGRLKFGQTIVLTGTEGPIVTTVKALLTPSKMQDLRVKCGYTEHKELMAAQGVGHRLNAQLALFISFSSPGENRSQRAGQGDSWSLHESCQQP